MPSFFSGFPVRTARPAAPAAPSEADRWHAAAVADYAPTRVFADRFDARLDRTERSRRVGWDRDGRSVYGLLLPDPLPADPRTGNDWYIYYVWGETLFRRTRRERDALQMLVLPDSAEDWAELLRRAVRETVFDVRWSVAPHFVNVLGEIETLPSGYEFTLSACAPPTAAAPDFAVSGLGETPDAAARDACLRWLKAALPGAAPEGGDRGETGD